MNYRMPSNRASGTSASRLMLGLLGRRGRPGAPSPGGGTLPRPAVSRRSDADSFTVHPFNEAQYATGQAVSSKWLGKGHSASLAL